MFKPGHFHQGTHSVESTCLVFDSGLGVNLFGISPGNVRADVAVVYSEPQSVQPLILITRTPAVCPLFAIRC